MSWCVYLLQCSDDSLYCGSTNDLKKRIAKHNKGKGAKYTRSRLPVVCLVTFDCEDKSSALKLEAKIKKLKREQKLQLYLDPEYISTIQ